MKMENEIVLFETKDKEISLRVPIIGETVWLTQTQMTDLFHVDRSVITRHINNVFKENELCKESNVQKMHIANSDKPVILFKAMQSMKNGWKLWKKEWTFKQKCWPLCWM